jgi:hypothetical protein
MHLHHRSWVGLALLAAFVAAPLGAGQNLLWELRDPRGDDHGDGRLIYPQRSDLARGDLDLISLRARRSKGGTTFEATFARPVRVPQRQAVDDLGTQLTSVARYGFYTLNLDIYIDTDHQVESGALAMMPGRLAEVAPESAWDRAIVLTPKPHAAAGSLKRLMAKQLSESLRSREDASQSREELRGRIDTGLEERVFFPTQVRVRGTRISFFVPDSFLGGPAQASWGYVVVVTGSDLIQSLDLVAALGVADARRDNLMALPVSPGTWQDRFGGGLDDEPLEPPVVDAIVPPDRSQEVLLRDFDSARSRPARLPAVIPAEQGVEGGEGRESR